MSAASVEGKKPRALGKGLDSLLPRITASAPAAASENESGQPLEVPVESIEANPNQTRKTFDERSLVELADSIKAIGVISPILVRALPEGAKKKYQLIAGERRWRASKLAGMATIPVTVRQVSDMKALEMTIVENLQREDLNPVEQARAYEQLSREFGMTQEQMAVRTGKDRVSVGNYIRLLKMPESVLSKVASGVISYSHARVLMTLDSQRQMEEAAEKILLLSLSVRHTEEHVRGLQLGSFKKKKDAVEAPPVDANVQDAQDRLQRALGLRVKIEDKDGRGRLIIEYGRLEDFDSLMEILTAGA